MGKKGSVSRRRAWIAGTVLGGIALDQVTKSIAIEHLKYRGRLSYLGDVFRWEYAENAGAFLGMGAALPEGVRLLLFGVIIAVMLFLVYFLLRSKDMDLPLTFGFSLIVSGGISNVIDRVFRTDGRVVDFMNLGIGSLRTGIFNVADVAIMGGVGLCLLLSWRDGKRR